MDVHLTPAELETLATVLTHGDPQLPGGYFKGLLRGLSIGFVLGLIVGRRAHSPHGHGPAVTLDLVPGPITEQK